MIVLRKGILALSQISGDIQFETDVETCVDNQVSKFEAIFNWILLVFGCQMF